MKLWFCAKNIKHIHYLIKTVILSSILKHLEHQHAVHWKFFLLLKRKALFHHTVNNKSVHMSDVDFLCESVDCMMK